MVKVLYEDNHILVAYKPRGILAQADGSKKEDMLSILKQYIKEKYQKPGNVYLGLVHRLDINTCGIMVFARTSKAARRLSLQILNHQFVKKYLAIIEGTLTEGTLHHKLIKDESLKKSIIDEHGKDAILDYKVLQTKKVNQNEFSLVDITLHTGRFHQIRAQFSEIGHPLVGDKKYGSQWMIDSLQFPLEAYYLSFYHPITEEKVEYTHRTLAL
ncbi:MAG: RluA family pseudouridine synthase [Anaeroplasmataceae bacterium]|nr:RluA family pseudouridine synthase [Anaeroplasmataceae bacterium]